MTVGLSGSSSSFDDALKCEALPMAAWFVLGVIVTLAPSRMVLRILSHFFLYLEQSFGEFMHNQMCVCREMVLRERVHFIGRMGKFDGSVPRYLKLASELSCRGRISDLTIQAVRLRRSITAAPSLV